MSFSRSSKIEYCAIYENWCSTRIGKDGLEAKKAFLRLRVYKTNKFLSKELNIHSHTTLWKSVLHWK